MAETIFAASVALIRKDDVLLIERAREPSMNYWTLPGGRLELGENAEQAAIREIREELGLMVYALRPLTILKLGPDKKHLLQVFGTQAFEGQIVPDPAEIKSWRWVKPHQIGGLRTTIDLGDVLERAFRLFDRS